MEKSSQSAMEKFFCVSSESLVFVWYSVAPPLSGMPNFVPDWYFGCDRKYGKKKKCRTPKFYRLFFFIFSDEGPVEIWRVKPGGATDIWKNPARLFVDFSDSFPYFNGVGPLHNNRPYQRARYIFFGFERKNRTSKNFSSVIIRKLSQIYGQSATMWVGNFLLMKFTDDFCRKIRKRLAKNCRTPRPNFLHNLL